MDGVNRTVDYAPLTDPVDPAAVDAFKAQTKASGAGWATIGAGQIVTAVIAAVVGLAVLIPITLVLTVTFTSFGTAGAGLGSLIGPLVVLLALGGTGFLVFRTVIPSRRRWENWYRLSEFARRNGLIYSPASPGPSYAGAIFGLGTDRRSLDHFRSADGRFLDFGNYRYTTGSGKQRTVHNWGFLALHLDRRLPHMLLDSKANNGLFGVSNLPISFDKEQVLSLEGDFDRYFTLYCPRQYERDALYVFTPDLMALLIDEAAPFDVEIVDDFMFVYSRTPFRPLEPGVYQRLLRIVDTIGAKTLSQTDRYRDERVGDFQANIVAQPGRRLKRRIPAVAIVVTLLVVGYHFWSIVGGILSD